MKKALLAFSLAILPACATEISYNGVGVQTFNVLTTGTYDIVAYGAQGGTSTSLPNPGGLGAEIGGIFNLTAGEILDIYVGGEGVSNSGAAGGGGGTFVVISGITPTLELVAGGGGGGEIGSNGLGGLTTQNGGPG
ncbi:MAG: hypothetical protein ABSF22_12865 [Bryobacteraceae bacterium]